jgi:hypothetical protein
MTQLWSNNSSTLLVNNISDNDTTILVSAGTGAMFPDVSNPDDFFIATMEDAFGNFEIVRCNTRVGDNMTCVRAHEGTTARAFSSGDRFELRITQGAMEEFLQDGDPIDGGEF